MKIHREKLGAADVSVALAVMFGLAGVVAPFSVSFLPENSFGQLSATTEWGRTFGGVGNDVAYSLVQLNDGSYALAGYTDSYGSGLFDFWFIKTDSIGRMLWNKTYGGVDWDIARSLIHTSDGGYALAGYTNSYGAGADDFYLVKVPSSKHDIAISSLESFKTVMGKGYLTSFDITTQNQGYGYFEETFNLTLYADQNVTVIGDEIKIASQNLTPPSGTSVIITVTWNTTTATKGT